jgi:hypothetical protein
LHVTSRLEDDAEESDFDLLEALGAWACGF